VILTLPDSTEGCSENIVQLLTDYHLTANRRRGPTLSARARFIMPRLVSDHLEVYKKPAGRKPELVLLRNRGCLIQYSPRDGERTAVAPLSVSRGVVRDRAPGPTARKRAY
jgi:hypothetical protein